MDFINFGLDLDHLVCVDDWLKTAEHGSGGAELEEVAFALFGGVSEGDAHEETVELVFGEWVGAEEVVGVLGRDDHEWFGEFVAVAVHGDHAFAHGFEERGLGSGAGPVDLVGEDDACEQGASLEAHFSGVS